MANMNRKRSEVIRVDSEVRKRIKDLTFELSAIEMNKVTTPEILKRTFSSPEVIEKLKLGSRDRRNQR